MKRILSFISSAIIGGMILWSIPPVEYSIGKTQPKSQEQQHLVLTPLDNPTLNDNPTLKQRLERSWENSGFYNVKTLNLNHLRTNSKLFYNQAHPNESPSFSNGAPSKKKSSVTTSGYNVDCEAIYDKEMYTPGQIVFYNSTCEEEFRFDYDPETWQPLPYLTANLPEGEYTAYAQFWIRYGKDGNRVKDGVCALVMKESVSVPCEEKLIFDASEATNQIKFNAILPDGTKATLPVKDFETDEVLVPGTIQGLGSQTWIIDKELGLVVFELFTTANQTSKVSEQIREYDLYVNDLSERFCANYVCSMRTMETSVIACEYIGELSGGNVETSNSADNYKVITTEIEHTPLYDQIGLVKNGYIVDICGTWTGKNIGGMGSEIYTDKDFIYYYQDPQSTPESFLPLVSVQPFDVSVYLEGEDWEGNPIQILYPFAIASLPFTQIDGQIQYVNNNHSECGNFSFQCTEDGPVYDYPGQPKYTFWADQQTGLIGDNAPINSVMNQITPYYENPSKFMNSVESAFIGRWGEVRNVDNAVAFTRITFNGEEVFNSNDPDTNMDMWGYLWGEVEDQEGEFNYYIDNQNIAVDGVLGRNYTHIYSDWRKEDKNAPVIQMLMFRNSLDEITDHFDNAADGIVEFSGGDFNWHTDMETYRFYFSCEPMEVKLEYSPYNQEAWSEIEVTEVPEYYFMPGFGYFYRGSLACVDKMSENGWYDLKFTFTDEVGNYMEQTVSPAFKVASLTGKAEISTSGVQVYANNGMLHVSADGVASVDVYSMDGRQVFRGTGNVIPMSHGAYIVKVNTTDGAESVHKIIL